MAAGFAHSNPDAVRGLVLWAACPAGSDDLSGHWLAAGSVHGTQDGLASEDKMAPFGKAAAGYGLDRH
jgi:hypothetical protein